MNLDQIFSSDNLIAKNNFDALDIVFSLSITFILAMFIYFIYKHTYSGILYSKNFNITLVMSALIVNVIMIGISGNIVLSLGMLGALSIIRFRTAVKDTKDTIYIFWSITLGIINGVAFYNLAIVSTIFIAIVAILLSKTIFNKPTFMLILHYTKINKKNLDETINQYCPKIKQRSHSIDNNEEEEILEIKIKNNSSAELINKLKKIPGMHKCLILSNEGEIAE